MSTHALFVRLTDRPLTGLAIFLLALGVRLLYLVDIHTLPYFHELVLDALEYDLLATGLLKGDWLLDLERGYVHGIGYPMLLAGLKWFGAGPAGARVVQSLMGSLCCWLIYRVGCRCATPAVGTVAGLLAALYWPFVVFGGELLAVTLLLTLQLALAEILLAGAETAVPRGFPRSMAALAGVLVALQVITRANAALLTPLVLWWVWRSRGDRGFRPCAELAAALLLTLTPYLARNQILQEIPIPFQGAWSFYQGANPDADGTPYVRQGAEWQRLELLPIRAGARSPAERGAYYLDRSLAFISDRPLEWLGLLYRKLRLFWHAHEVPVSADLRTYEARSRLRPFLPLSMGVVVPLAFAGLAMGGGLRLPSRRLVAGFVLVWLASGLLFTVSARYRLPAAPFLIVFAGLGATALVGGGLRREVRRCLVGLGVVVAGVIVAHTGVDVEAVDHLRSEWLLGHVYLKLERYDEAERILLAARARQPESADVHNSLGVVHEHRGRLVEAERAYRRCVELAPEYARGWLNLGGLLTRRNQLAEGTAAIGQALDLDPRAPVQYDGWYLLGQAALAQGRFGRARHAFARALKARETAAAWYGRSAASAGLGLQVEQIRFLERAVALDSSLAPAQRNLGALYLREGRYGAAERALLAAAAADPTESLTHRHLGDLYQLLGRTDAARRAQEKARLLGTH